MNLKEKLAGLLKQMRDVTGGAKAAGRDLNAEEIKALETLNDEYLAVKIKIEEQEAEQAKGDALIGRIVTPRPAPAMKASDWARKATSRLDEFNKKLSVDGVKAFTVGAVSVPSLLSPVTIDTRPTSVLDLIPVVSPRGEREGNGFEYARQTQRVNNASAVPDKADKPESDYGFEEVEDHFRVYANKVSDIPWRYLTDHAGLLDIVQAQLAEDTLLAIEADVLSGNGTNDAFTGILNTTGIQTQTFETDRLGTLTEAKYKLVGNDRNLTGWAMNPNDLKALETMRENGSTGGFLFSDRTAIEDYLGGPITTSNGIPAGIAIAADWTQAELIPLSDDELVQDVSGRTKNNTFELLFEGRYGFRVKRPADFVVALLTGN